MADHEKRCVFEICPRPAVSEKRAIVGQWHVVLPLCDEHARELAKDTPLGGLVIDKTRIDVYPMDGSIAQAPMGFGAVGPQ